MKKNVEHEIANYYKAEAKRLEMPAEEEIRAMKGASAGHKQAQRHFRVYRVAAILSCGIILLVSLFTIPLLRQGNSPVVDDPILSGTSQTNAGGTVHSSHTTPPPQSNVTTPALNPAYPDLSLLSFAQWKTNTDVVWAEGSEMKGNTPTGLTLELGNTRITDDLRSQFAGQSKETVYAVMVDFTPMISQNILFEGKTLAEWNTEKEALIGQGKMAEAKEIVQKINQAKENNYFEHLELFKEKFSAMGLGVYHEEHGCTINNCIFYTFATQAQIEEFTCDPNEAFIFAAAVRFK